MQDITALMELVATRDEISREIVELYENHASVVKEIEETCFHPTVTKKSSYHNGGYDYKSENRTWDACTICGKIFNSKTVFGSFA